MFWIQALVAVAIVCGTVLVAAGRGDGVSLPTRDERPDWAEREGPIAAEDLDTLQITVAARGYRMDEVDGVLDRLGAEIQVRDARIAQLEHVLEHQRPAPTPRGLEPSAWDPHRTLAGSDQSADDPALPEPAAPAEPVPATAVAPADQSAKSAEDSA